jgi:hypothetical protein
MPQLLLPGFPIGATTINETVSVYAEEGHCVWLLGQVEIFRHAQEDQAGFKTIVSALMNGGLVRPSEFERSSLKLTHRTLMNWRKQYQLHGASVFYRIHRSRPAGRVMTTPKVSSCQRMLDAGQSIPEVARETGINESTLRKAMARGVLSRAPAASACDLSSQEPASTKTQRAGEDARAGMGVACTRPQERVAAALGISGAIVRFEPCVDVPLSGVLAALPALEANGLFSGIGHHLRLPKGFYGILSILMLLGFMALARVKRPEGLRHLPPGELGKLLGLDRAPEVRTLRQKVAAMADQGGVMDWMLERAGAWMREESEEAGYLYVDGHVRTYTGQKANLPRRYVSRQRLCLRGSTDYWVNDALGRPFFVVSKSVTEGLAATLLEDILPDLLQSVPGQPSEAQLAADATLHRFVVVFDREGATHDLLSKLWKHRVAAITYRKAVKDLWPESEFKETEVPIPGVGSSTMLLATRQSALCAGEASIPVTEVRKLGKGGHQTVVMTTALQLAAPVVAGRMFARWCQENFFAYMMQQYDIDGLVQYGAEELPGTVQVVNPAWRVVDQQVRQTRGQLRTLEAQAGRIAIDQGVDIQKRAELHQRIEQVQSDLEGLRQTRKGIARKIALSELPEAQRPNQLLPLRKTLVDTVKMIAYRAETALVGLLRRHLNKPEDGRGLIRELFTASADIQPNPAAGTLTIRIHRMACLAHDKAIMAVLTELTAAEYRHPQTQATMIFEMA